QRILALPPAFVPLRVEPTIELSVAQRNIHRPKLISHAEKRAHIRVVDAGSVARGVVRFEYCVAGHVGLELRNVVANYPFERSHRFTGIQPKLATETIRVGAAGLGRRSSGLVPALEPDLAMT